MYSKIIVLFVCTLISAGCGESTTTTKLVVTADWLNQSLTLLEFSKVVDGQVTTANATLGTIDLSDWEPGPLEVEITPDGKTAVVSISPGFFDGLVPGLPPLPPGGALLLVDLESRTATEVETEHVPMGIAISPDGTRAYTANYGAAGEPGSTMSIIDIATATNLADIEVGSLPEQVALSPDGSLGIINLAEGDGIRVFQTSDPEATLSDLVATGNDPSGVTFLGSNDRAVVANSLSSDIVMIDTSDPENPAVVVDGGVVISPGLPYGVTYDASRDQILAPTGTNPTLMTIDIDGDSLSIASMLDLPGGGFPLVAAIGTQSEFAFVAHLEDQTLSIVDLSSRSARGINWLSEPGPTYAAVQP